MGTPAGTVHGTCLVLGEAGILILGPSGAGKSRLALDILTEAARAGRFARLVADDRVRLEPRAGRLLARAVERTAGLVEARGLGLVPVPHEPAALVRLVVECGPGDPARYPDRTERRITVHGVALPRFACGPEGAVAGILLWRGLAGLDRDTILTDP